MHVAGETTHITIRNSDKSPALDRYPFDGHAGPERFSRSGSPEQLKRLVESV